MELPSFTENEIATLTCLNEEKEPLGSWYLANRLKGNGIDVSSATIGRVLSRLEYMGYVEKSSNSGRIITNKGITALSENILSNIIKRHSKTLEKTIATNVLEDFMLILQARKAIERETAGLAAQNATKAELDAMQLMIEEQEGKHARGESIAHIDIEFHQAIARASRNKVLETLYIMLFSYGQQTEIFEYMRKQVNSVYMISHRQILEAIRARNPEAAEVCMVAHMKSLMEDVSKFWDIFYQDVKHKHPI